MRVIDLDVCGLKIIVPMVFSDDRGFFMEAYRANRYKDILGVEFKQDNMSYSKYGTIRGMHYQKTPQMQAKLVRCSHGEIMDVAVDIRTGSPTFGKHSWVILSAKNCNQFFIPEGFAHGFSVLSKEAVVEYKCSNYYHPESDAGIIYDDEQLGINWMIPLNERILSDKDLSLPCLSSLERR